MGFISLYEVTELCTVTKTKAEIPFKCFWRKLYIQCPPKNCLHQYWVIFSRAFQGQSDKIFT